MAEFKTILPQNASAFERAIEESMAVNWPKIDADIIRRFNDPWQCPTDLLNFLAFQRSVDIWDDTWPELKQRSVIASAPADHRVKGTHFGLQRYVEIAEGTLEQVVVPPQFIAVMPGYDKAAYDAYVEKHPKIRITLARGKGDATGLIAVDDGAIGVDAISLDDGPALYGRRAYLYRQGEQTPLQIVTLTTESEERQGVEIERYYVPGSLNGYTAIGEAAIAVDPIGDIGIPAVSHTVRLDRTYQHSESNVGLSLVPVGFQPRDVRYKRESLIGDATGLMVIGADAVADAAISRDDAGELLADVLYLVDPTIPAPVYAEAGAIGDARLGMRPHSAEIRVDWHQIMPEGLFAIGRSAIGIDAVSDSDDGTRDFFLDAVSASKRLTDKVLVSFQQTRPRTLDDGIPLDGSFEFDAGVPFRL